MRGTKASSALWASSLVTGVISQESVLPTKRGLAYISGSNEHDIDLLLSGKSYISWYYTWSLYASSYINDSIPFVPLVHGLDEASALDSIDDLPATSTHLLTVSNYYLPICLTPGLA